MAVQRIIDGNSNAATEAQRLNLSKRNVERMVAATRKVMEDAGKTTSGTTSPTVQPSGATSQKGSNPSLEAAKRGAGLDGGATSAAGAAAAGQAAVVDMQQQCVDQVGMMWTGGFSALVSMKYSPPLDLMSQEMQKAVALPPLAETVIRTNAPTLYPFLSKLMSGPYQLVAGLAIAACTAWMGIHAAAVRAGWAPKAKAPAPSDAFAEIAKAREKPVAKPELRPAEKATQEVLRPGALDPKPGTQLEAPTIPSGLI